MIRNLVMYSRPADPDKFKEYYLEHHLPLCRAIPGTLSIQYAFEPEKLQGAGDWFCVYEAEYADEAALSAARETPEAAIAAADVANYSPEPPLVLIYQVDCAMLS